MSTLTTAKQRENQRQLTDTNQSIFEALKNKTADLAVVGLGYVGLPVALEFARHFSVLGFDINEKRVEMMNNSEDPSGELKSSAFDNKEIRFTLKAEQLAEAKFFVVAVPTPIDKQNQPDLSILKSATTTVAKALKKGDYVVFESTVYPGCTEEVCVPILEQISGLQFNVDFKVGYSPERINPGDKTNTVDKIVKIVSGSDDEALENIANVYRSIITAGIHCAPTLKVAEAAKIVENTQRDVNIALMNELSMIFEKMGVNTFDVLEAAGTKWNFLKFYPGLVGGHCIGVDPYYLINKAIRIGHNPILISAGRSVNDGMPAKIANKIINELQKRDQKVSSARILVMGATFKENVTDIRNSKAADIVLELQKSCKDITVVDSWADAGEMRDHYGIEMSEEATGIYDAIVVAVSHETYINMNAEQYVNMMTEDGFVMDVKGILKDRIESEDYYSL